MASRNDNLDARISALEQAVAGLRAGLIAPAVNRWRADAAALRFHLSGAADRPLIVTLLGGTGTGKSTLVNRLLEGNFSATSFHRTFTSGPIAFAHDTQNLPPRWLGVEHVSASSTELPARGKLEALVVVPADRPLTRSVTLIDTPDLDGDQPAHHAQADRAFRWTQAVVFLVTPEKYQMTELLPYYRLARRYALPAVFVMNKCEESAVLDDFSEQLAAREWPQARIFAIPRDDAAYEPPAEANLASLRSSIQSLELPVPELREEGLMKRTDDLLDRFQDQILAPLLEDRREVDRMIASLRSLEAPPAGVDVNPITQQLQRRLQQRSVLYLMGPQRVLERVRQVPSMLARLPRTAWDLVMRGQVPAGGPNLSNGHEQGPPDFGATLVDQLTIVQSRIDDVIRSSPAGQRWIDARPDAYAATRLPPEQASRIVKEELAELRSWLEKRWNAAPRDTRIVQRLLKHLPGGERLTQWSEAAPYLLAVIVATHHAFFGPVDLLVIGGWSLATWISEKLSNEVAAQTRATNRQIAERFTRLAHQQIEQICTWLEEQAPSSKELSRLEHLSDSVASLSQKVA